MMFYDVLTVFNAFYRFLSAEMPENDQKWSETAKNVHESLRKFTKVHESQRLLRGGQKKAKQAKFIASQRSLRASCDTGG